MIIDCHGHFTTVPEAHERFRIAQHEYLRALGGSLPVYPRISDDQIRETILQNQAAKIAERGIDMTLFSPRASWMEHHVDNAEISQAWAEACNNLVARVVDLFPGMFAGVCQLPQTPSFPIELAIAELERCVNQLGFVGCNLNPDPSGGHWTSPPVTDHFWYPFYEKMVELDVPAMIHVSASCNSCLHGTGAHYINGDTAVFMQLVQGDLFRDFPGLRLVIPHGGGAAPYHWGRYRGLAAMLGRPELGSHLLNNLFFDTCIYHQAGIDLLLRVVPIKNILFGSEMIGAVRGIDPETGRYFDDTRAYIETASLTAAERAAIYEGNARRIYPRLDRMIAALSTHRAPGAATTEGERWALS